MKILALDISSHCGWALLETVGNDELPKLLEYETVHLGQTVFEVSDHYPTNYRMASGLMGQKIVDIVTKTRPDVIVIEEINKAKNRWSQKYLDWIHIKFLDLLIEKYPQYLSKNLFYIDSSQWRKVLGIQLTKEDKKKNAIISKAKNISVDKLKEVKKTTGIKGKVNKKHVAVRWVNEKYNLTLKQKDNDLAEAACLGIAYALGAKTCNGK
jgi:Holliday junction resolvasome RuvABC endonuclease subunit